MPRPYVLLSGATSIDSRIDDTSPERLLLSNPDDFDRVDQVRAEVDAILIGAGTMRADNPRLLVNSETRRAGRVAAGKPAYSLKGTITGSGDLDPGLKFWHHGDKKLAYTGMRPSSNVLAVPFTMWESCGGDKGASRAHVCVAGDLRGGKPVAWAGVRSGGGWCWPASGRGEAAAGGAAVSGIILAAGGCCRIGCGFVYSADVPDSCGGAGEGGLSLAKSGGI